MPDFIYTPFIIIVNFKVAFHIVDEASELPELEADPFRGAVR